MECIRIFCLVIAILVLCCVCASFGDGGAGNKRDTPQDGSDEATENPADDETVRGKISAFDKFKTMFAQNRAIQLNAIKSLQHFGDNMQRHKLVEIMLQQLFLTLAQARVNLTEWGVLPGDPFPEEEKKQESVSKVYENTAMFGDMVLRLPGIVHPLYDKNREWQMTLKWCTMFCNESLVFEGTTGTMLHLMAQEVDLVPKSPNYVNPFKDVDPKEKEKFVKQVKKEMNKKKKKKIAKGPRLSHTEL